MDVDKISKLIKRIQNLEHEIVNLRKDKKQLKIKYRYKDYDKLEIPKPDFSNDQVEIKLDDMWIKMNWEDFVNFGKQCLEVKDDDYVYISNYDIIETR